MSQATKGSPPKTNRKRVALIDADGILFAEACTSEFMVNDGEGPVYLDKQSPDEAFANVIRRFEDLITTVEADTAILCLTSRTNWRYDVLPTYKANRSNSRRPPMLTVLRDMLQERKPWPVLLVDDLEADDVCGISVGHLEGELREVIICSPDKDLRTIPCYLYACRTDSKIERIDEDAANYHHLFQTLVGDTVDNYTGCPKVGKVKAAKLLEPFWDEGGEVFDVAGAWEAIVAAFEKVGLDAEYALRQARVARILRSEDWDQANRRVRLWEPPVKRESAE